MPRKSLTNISQLSAFEIHEQILSNTIPLNQAPTCIMLNSSKASMCCKCFQFYTLIGPHCACELILIIQSLSVESTKTS